MWFLWCPVQGWEFDFNVSCFPPKPGLFSDCSEGHQKTPPAPWLFEMLLLAAVILSYRSWEGLGRKSILPVLWGLHSKFPQVGDALRWVRVSQLQHSWNCCYSCGLFKQTQESRKKLYHYHGSVKPQKLGFFPRTGQAKICFYNNFVSVAGIWGKNCFPRITGWLDSFTVSFSIASHCQTSKV